MFDDFEGEICFPIYITSGRDGVSLFDSLNYILEPVRLTVAMARVCAHLQESGLFIFDLNTEFALQNNFFDQHNLNRNSRLRYDWTSLFFPETRLCRVDMQFWRQEEGGEVRAFRETHWQFAYRMTDIHAMLHAAGFDEIATYQAYTFRQPSRTSDRLFYIARRAPAS